MNRLSRNRKAIRIFAICCGLLLVCLLTAKAEMLPIKTYTSADGLIYDGVYRIYQDSRGFVWFATPVGISRFDGYRFTNYGMEDGLTYTLIRDFVEDDNGVYWLGTNGGNDNSTAIYRFDPRVKNSDEQKFVPFKISDEPATRDVYRFFKTKSGRIFVGTGGGLFLLDDSQPEHKFSRVRLNVLGTKDDLFPVYAFAENAEGNLWIGHERGLTRLNPSIGKIVTYAVKPSSDEADTIYSIGIDGRERLWLVNNGRGITIFNPEPAASIDLSNNREKRNLETTEKFDFADLPQGFAYHFKPEETPAEGSFVMVYCTADGAIFFGTRGKGLIEFDGRNFKSYTRENGLSDNSVSFIREDSFGNLWVVSGWGVMKIARKGFVSYNTADGLFSDRVTDIFTDRDGWIYALNQNWILNGFDGKRFVSVRPNLPADVGEFWNHRVLHDSAGEWWIPTPKGLYRFAAVERLEQLASIAPVAVYTKNDGLNAGNVVFVFEDSRGDVWFSYAEDEAKGHLSRWERESGKFYHYSPADGVPETCRPFGFTADAAGTVYVNCQFESYLVYRNGRFAAHSTPALKKGGLLHRTLLDSKGRLWIATPLNGLLRYDNPASEDPQETVYLKENGLSSSHVQYITEDLHGKIYFVTSRGMDRLDAETGAIKYYSLADGLPAAGTGAATRDLSGNLWLGTSRGVAKFVPEPDQPSSSPPVFIGSLRIAGNDFPLSVAGENRIENLTLAPDERQMQIEFYGLNLAAGESLRYQYKLEGADADWSAPTDNRAANYPNLTPGTYRFLVRAVNPGGNVSQNPATIEFTVLRPVWQRWWFLLLAAMTVSTIAYAVYRYRLARLLELEKVRTRIATDLHDDIGSSLSQIAILTEVVRQKVGSNGVSEPLNLIADTSREMVDSMSDIVWAINPNKDHLSDLIQRMRRFAEDVLDAKEIVYKFDLPQNVKDLPLGADMRREVYLMFKESVNNLVKHSEAKRAEFEIKIENSNLIVTIKDDGRGFDVSEKLNGGANGFGGNGLINMRRRAANLGGSFEIESAPEKGALIVLKIPVGKRIFPV